MLGPPTFPGADAALKLDASKTAEANSRATDKVTRSTQAPDESFCRFFIYFSPFPPVVSAFWLLLMERHLWPFTGVLSEIGREVTGTNAGIFQTEGNPPMPPPSLKLPLTRGFGVTRRRVREATVW